MSSIGNDTQSLLERELFIAEDLLPKIPKMRRYLGSIDFNTEFYARKRHGQSNWEFEDRDTKRTFEAAIIGEIADVRQGTMLKAKGNYRAPKFDPNQRLNDRSNVKDIIVLCKLSASNVMAEKAFFNQTVPLNNIFEHILADDEQTRLRPSNGNRMGWLDTTAASDASNRALDLIVISLPKKFDAPPKTANTSQRVGRVIERVPLTDDDDNVGGAKRKELEKSKVEEAKVVVGGFYEPSLLPDYSADDFDLVKNKLVQHDVTDIDDRLIPAWKMEAALRPGTVVLVSASLHVYNIGPATDFRRYYQINAERIKVLAKPLAEEVSMLTTQPSTPPKAFVFDDFALFTPKKRKDGEEFEDHLTKKNKIQKAEEGDFEMVLQKDK